MKCLLILSLLSLILVLNCRKRKKNCITNVVWNAEIVVKNQSELSHITCNIYHKGYTVHTEVIIPVPGDSTTYKVSRILDTQAALGDTLFIDYQFVNRFDKSFFWRKDTSIIKL